MRLPDRTWTRPRGLGFRGLRVLGFKGSGFKGLRVSGFKGAGFRVAPGSSNHMLWHHQGSLLCRSSGAARSHAAAGDTPDVMFREDQGS